MVLLPNTEQHAALSSTPPTSQADEQFAQHTCDSMPSQQHDDYAYLQDPDLPSTTLSHSPHSHSAADTKGDLSDLDAELLFPGFRLHVQYPSW